MTEAVVLRDGTSAWLRRLETDDHADRAAAEHLLTRALPEGARAWVISTGPDAGEPALGVGTYVHTAPGEAEAQFAVDPRWLRRGVGTLLLQHVVSQAHAEEMPLLLTNAEGDEAALEVLGGSGLELREHGDAGRRLIEVVTESEERAQALWDERERAATAASLRPFFHPGAVAVVGVSRTGGIGRDVFDRLIEAAPEVPIYPVNPSAHAIRGIRAYPSIGDIPDSVDLAVVAVPAAAVLETVDACADAGVRALVVLSAGFAETGEDGRRRQEQVVRTVRARGMRMIGPNCLGIFNADPEVRLNAAFGRPLPPAGHVAMSSQSGAMGLVIADYANELGLGLSTFASVGNKADVSGNDLLQYWESDAATDVIVLYLESFGNPRKFSRIARRVAARKPVLAVKSGRSAAGSRAAGSHTAALAASDVATDALFRQAGVLRVDTLEELFDVTSLLANQPLPTGPRVAVLTNAGGPGILCADAAEAGGLTLPSLDEATVDALRAMLPAAAGLGNPVDMLAAATPDQYEFATHQVLLDPNVDSLIVMNVSIGGPRAGAFIEAIERGRAIAAELGADQKPVLICALSPDHAEGVAAGRAGATIPVYRFPESPARALARAAERRAWLDRPAGRVAVPDGVDREGVRRVLDRATDRGRRWLEPDDVEGIIAAAGVPMLRARTVAAPAEAGDAAREIGFPVALKVVSSEIQHKTDVGGVVLGLGDPEAVRDAAEEMLQRIAEPIEGFLVQQMAGEGIELILGMTSDPVFGPLVGVGLGGTAVEVLRDTAFRLTPLTDVDADEMLRDLRGAPLLEGYRGAPPGDRDAVIDLLRRLSWLAEAAPEIRELDLNPVRVFPDGDGLVALDARISIG